MGYQHAREVKRRPRLGLWLGINDPAATQTASPHTHQKCGDSSFWVMVTRTRSREERLLSTATFEAGTLCVLDASG